MFAKRSSQAERKVCFLNFVDVHPKFVFSKFYHKSVFCFVSYIWNDQMIQTLWCATLFVCFHFNFSCLYGTGVHFFLSCIFHFYFTILLFPWQLDYILHTCVFCLYWIRWTGVEVDPGERSSWSQ